MVLKPSLPILADRISITAGQYDTIEEFLFEHGEIEDEPKSQLLSLPKHTTTTTETRVDLDAYCDFAITSQTTAKNQNILRRGCDWLRHLVDDTGLWSDALIIIIKEAETNTLNRNPATSTIKRLLMNMKRFFGQFGILHNHLELQKAIDLY